MTYRWGGAGSRPAKQDGFVLAFYIEHPARRVRFVRLLRTAIVRLGLSARAYHRVLKIARTIADLGGSLGIEPAHVSEAVQYRSLDRAMG